MSTNYAAFLNQGCLPDSLYQQRAYGTVNSNGTLAGALANIIGLNNGTDLFGNHPLQSRNLHDIESVIQPSTGRRKTWSTCTWPGISPTT